MAALTTRDATLAATYSQALVRALLHDAARLVPIEQAERRILVLENPGLEGPAVRALGLYQLDTERRA